MRAARYEVTWPAVADRGDLRVLEPPPPLVEREAPRLAAFYNDPHNRALLTNTQDFTPADVVEHYASIERAGGYNLLLYEGQTLLGDCDLRNVDGDRAEFAILVGPRGRQGKGLGTRFAIMAHALAFGHAGLAALYVSVRPENTGSLRLFDKLGYLPDASPAARRYAEEADDVCLGIRREVFLARHQEAFAAIGVKLV